MERYITIKIDKAQRLEDYVQRLKNRINKGLIGGKISKSTIRFNETIPSHRKDYFDGDMWVRMEFDKEDDKEEPIFLLERDKARWQSEIKTLAKDGFGVDIEFDKSTYCTCFRFEEPSKKELYELTENKINIINAEFETIKNFVKWYCYAVKKYDSIRQNGYFSKLETLALNNQNSQKTL